MSINELETISPDSAAGAPAPALDDRSFRRQLRRATLALALALGIPGLGLLGLVIFLLRASSWVDHSDQVIAHSHSVEKQLVGMQTSFRGYRLTGDEAFLKGYQEGVEDGGVMEDMLALEEMTADNPVQAQAAKYLRPAAMDWFAFANGELKRVKGNPGLIRDPGFLKQGVPLFEAVRSRLEPLLAEEQRLREERARRLKWVVRAVLGTFAVAAVVGIPALVFWLRGLLRRLRQAYQISLDAAKQRAGELQVTLRSIGDAVVATDDAGRVEFLNPAAEAMMGWSQEEVKGRLLTEVFEIFNEYTREPAENPVGRVLRENVVVGLANHTVLRSRHGVEIPIEDSAAPIRGSDGKVRGVILVFHDVTEKHRSAVQLRESESRLFFLNELGETIRELDDPDAIREASVVLLGKFLKVSRCSFATVHHETGLFTVLSDWTDGCESSVGDYTLGIFGPRAETKMRRGRTLVVRNVAEEIEDGEGGAAFTASGIQAAVCCPLAKEGRLCAMMAVHQTTPRNWTESEVKLVETVVERVWSLMERRKAERELVMATSRAEQSAQSAAEAAERFRMLGEVMSLQVWTAGTDGNLDYVNQQVLKYFGISDPGMVLGTGWTQYVHPSDLPGARGRWRHSLNTGERYHAEFRLRAAMDGQYRWHLARAEPMRDKFGRIAKWFGTNTAIHELKTAQDAAERANQAKDDFLARLSHELRTPLTPALMVAASLRDDTRLPADARDQLGMMERNIALEARLIDDLLDLTAISRGKLRLRPERSDAHALIRLAVDIIRGEAESKGLELRVDFQATRTGLMVDPARFQQVIWNLLRNAVKFTPSRGRIEIRTRDMIPAQGPAWLRMEIADNGVGIEAAALEQIFLPFEQGAVAGDHRFGGVGLGLSIARAIVTLHGGQIRARSEGHNRGATFTVELPDAVEAPALEENDPDSVAGAGHRPAEAAVSDSVPPLRLLLVEDHEPTLEALRTLLMRAGHTVTAVGTVADALAAADRDRFDLVISDLGLPDGTGTNLMERLRDTWQLEGIALSGYGMEEDIERCREAGFSAHLVKPVRFADLKAVLASMNLPGSR